jgi:hypothetical protein
MDIFSPNFIKNFFLEKLLTAYLQLMREKKEITNFLERFQSVKKVLIILPRDRAEEIMARNYVSKFRKIFRSTHISIFDIFNLREKDVSWLGVPNTFFITKFRDEKFDLLIDLNSYHDTLCCYIGALIGPPLRIHFSHGKYDKIYNLQINLDTQLTLESRYKNFIEYLARLRNSESKVSMANKLL